MDGQNCVKEGTQRIENERSELIENMQDRDEEFYENKDGWMVRKSIQKDDPDDKDAQLGDEGTQKNPVNPSDPSKNVISIRNYNE
jgi:hypothetical protein